MLKTLTLLLLLIVATLGTNVTTVGDDCMPEQIFAGLGNSYYYASQHTSSHLENNDAIVVFETKVSCPGAVLQMQDFTNRTYILHPWEVVNFTANYTDGVYQSFIHVFYLFGLEQNQEYIYTAIAPNGNSSRSNRFVLPNSVAPAENQFSSYIVTGDWDHSDYSSPTWGVLSQLVNETNYKRFSHVVFMGDLAYDLEDDAGRRGDFYFQQISQGIGSYLPFMTIPGNHEQSFNFSNYVNRVRSPLWEKTNNHYYSYNTGLIHWVTFNFDFYSANPNLVPQMLAWLSNDLKVANENRNQWPWIVFLNHRPIYCSKTNANDCTDNANVYTQVEDILYANSVDLFLSGHVHSYERMLPIYKHQVAKFETKSADSNYEYIINPTAPVHILEGIAGCAEDSDLELYPSLDFSVTIDFDLGYGILNCHNATHLEYSHMKAADNSTSDHMYLIKENPKYPIHMIE